MQLRHQVGLLQNLAGGLERLGIDLEQHLLCAPRSPPDARRDRPARSTRLAAISAIAPSPPSATFSAITANGLAPCGGKHAAASLSTSLAMRSGCAIAKASATVPPKPLPIRIEVVANAEFLEAVLDRRDIGIHQRQRRRLRAVKARQVDQRDAMFCGERRQNRIEGVAVGQQRMQHHQIAAFARCAPR